MAWVQCCECGRNGDSNDMIPAGVVDDGGQVHDEYICEDCYDAGLDWYPLVDEYREAEQHGSDVIEMYGDYLPYTEK